jgi:Flp pilus assembly protein TadG
MVEFSLIATVLFVIIFGLVDFAYTVFSYNTVCNAARAAVRFAIVHGPNSGDPASAEQIQQVAISSAPGVNLNADSITVSWPNDPNLPSKQDAQVQISYEHHMLVGYLIPARVTLGTTSRMLVSQ